MRLVILCFTVLSLAACCGAPSPTATPQIVEGTAIVRVTQPPEPTNTPRLISTPSPAPTATPAPIQKPIVLTGSGSAVVDVDKTSQSVLVHITGNAASRHFAVTNYGAGNKKYDLLVNTTDPYDGIRPLDFLDQEHTTRFEVKAADDWTIEIVPLDWDRFRDEGRLVVVPGGYSGTGNDVFFVEGDCDTATIAGNDAGRYFGIHAWYSNGRDLLVNTTDPFQGTVLMTKDTFAVEVVAVGSWSMDITAP